MGTKEILRKLLYAMNRLDPFCRGREIPIGVMPSRLIARRAFATSWSPAILKQFGIFRLRTLLFRKMCFF